MNRRRWPASLFASLALMACSSSTPAALTLSSPSPSGWPSTDNRLTSVACPDASYCVAVGFLAPGYAATGTHNRTLIEESTAGKWSLAVSPNANGAEGSALYGVTCIDAHDCIAVGDSQDSAANATTLIEEDTGGGWTIVPGPHAAGSLAAVACAGADHCVAVGRNEAAGRTLIEENRGDGWQMVPSADATVGGDDWLSAVACPSRNLCVAVGGSSLTPERSLPLVEESSGAGWTIIPVSGEGPMLGVACPSPAMCVATGSETYVENYPNIVLRNVIEEWTQGRWASIAPPAGDVGLLGPVACPDPGYCVAVETLGQSPLGIIERSGQGWSAGTGGGVTNTIEKLTAVTCVDRTACIVVGDQWLGGPADYIRPRATFIAEHARLGWTVEDTPNA